ncbi:hypothetical protein H4R24_000543 [Coemansia sp. RSA 988]|nr:hypothetical protein H4R24_000543 [Coemansia sp. RSA 988]
MSSLFTKDGDARIDIFDPSKVPGSSVYMASNGTDLGMQAIFAGSFFLLFILLFSALRLRWPFIFSPRTRLTITAPPYLSRKFFGWILATMRTPETYILNTLGLDTVIFLRFYKMCMRLLLDVAFFSIVIIWPINIYWSKVNLDAEAHDTSNIVSNDGDLKIPVSYSVTDYLFNLTLNTSDPKQQYYLVPHIVFVYIFSGLAYYHISKFSSRWASLRWHFLMQSRHALVSRTVMLTGVPRHLAKSPRELEWFWSAGLQLGKIERVRVCPFNTRLTSSAKERAKCLIKLEHAYKSVLGNPCQHPDYDPEQLRVLAMDVSDGARARERVLLEKWAKPTRHRKCRQQEIHIGEESQQEGDACELTTIYQDIGEKSPELSADQRSINRPMVWVRSGSGFLQPWKHVDAIDHWRERFLAADHDFRQLRDSVGHGDDDHGWSTTAFVTFEDAATAHMVTQLSCYPNPGYMKARLAPEPRGVYWPNIWISNHRKWAGFTAKWVCIFLIWAFWSVPVILFSSLLTPASLGRIFPVILSSEHNMLRAFLSTTVPSVFLLLFLNMLPWILKQVHFATGARTKPDIDYSVMTKMWAFLVFNVILVFGFSGTFWNLIVDAVNKPGTVMQSLASNIPRVGTFFTGYILVLGVGYQPFKLLQVRPVIWHIGRQWLCSTPRDYARLVSPVYIDWYSVYPYPLLVFAIAMVYSTFSPPVVLGAIIYYAIGYPVMKYLLLYVYFHPFETAGMAWPKVCRRMILSIIIYQVVMLTFVIVKGGGWYTFSLVPIIMLYLWFFYFLGWSLEKQGTVLPVYLWRNPPPNSSYPLPPNMDGVDACNQQHPITGTTYDTSEPTTSGKEAPLYMISPDAFSPESNFRAGTGSRGKPLQTLRGTSSYDDISAQEASRRPPPYPNRVPVSAGVIGTKSNVYGARRNPQIAAAPPSSPQSFAATASAAALAKSNGRHAKRLHGYHQRESSRGARTREIILSGRNARRISPGVGVTWHRRANGRTSPHRYQQALRMESTGILSQNIGQKQQQQPRDQHNSPSCNSRSSGRAILRNRSFSIQPHSDKINDTSMTRASGNATYVGSAEACRVNKRKRYKSLAEAATAEGSRLIMTLGRLPGEIYSWRLENKRLSQSTMSKSFTSSIRNKRRSLSGQLSSHTGDTDTADDHGKQSNANVCLDSAVGSAEKDGDNGQRSPSKASLVQKLRAKSQSRLASNAEKNAEDDSEWVDTEPDDEAACISVSSKRRGKMAAVASSFARNQDLHSDLEELDPPIYLKPVGVSKFLYHSSITDKSHSKDNAGGTLGTLLTDLDYKQSSVPSNANVSDNAKHKADPVTASISAEASSGLRRRRCYNISPQAENGSQAAASIIDAEGAPHHSEPQHQQRGFRALVQHTFHQVRDYFLAEFRPAVPILDLTYDRLYSQGIEESEPPTRTDVHGEYVEDNRDTLPPLRQLIGKVLPRSVSRVFSPPQNNAQVPPGITHAATAPPERTCLTSHSAAPSNFICRASTAAAASLEPICRQSREPTSALLAQAEPAAIKGYGQFDGLSQARSTYPPSQLDTSGAPDCVAHNPDCAKEPLQPPRPPWLALEVGDSSSSLARARISSQPLQARQEIYQSPSSSDTSLPASAYILREKRSSHKNSLPPPRAPLTARMVSELNYVTRRSVTPNIAAQDTQPSWMSLHSADGSEGEQLMVANYQRFAVERQSKFEADECTDYQQTPMLNFRGILDRGIQDYVHPGLVGELPTLWLPVKHVSNEIGNDHEHPNNGSDEDPSTQAGNSDHGRPGLMKLDGCSGDRELAPSELSRQLAMTAPYRRIVRFIEQHRGDAVNCTDAVAAIVAAAAAAGDVLTMPSFSQSARPQIVKTHGYSELQEVCVHQSESARSEFPDARAECGSSNVDCRADSLCDDSSNRKTHQKAADSAYP